MTGVASAAGSVMMVTVVSRVATSAMSVCLIRMMAVGVVIGGR